MTKGNIDWNILSRKECFGFTAKITFLTYPTFSINEVIFQNGNYTNNPTSQW